MSGKTYMFVGTVAQVGDREFDAIGQKVVFTDQQYKEVIRKIPFIPEDRFKRVGFTPEELAVYGHGGSRSFAPMSFLEKLGLALQVFRDMQKACVEDAVPNNSSLNEDEEELTNA